MASEQLTTTLFSVRFMKNTLGKDSGLWLRAYGFTGLENKVLLLKRETLILIIKLLVFIAVYRA